MLDVFEPTMGVSRVWGMDMRTFPMATLKISKSLGWENKSPFNKTLVTAVN